MEGLIASSVYPLILCVALHVVTFPVLLKKFVN